MNQQTDYKPVFYSSRKEGVRNSAEEIVPLIVDWLNPRSAVDVGCGDGVWLSVLSRFGVTDVVGIDGNWVTKDMLEIESDRFQPRDLSKPIEANRQFDLVLSLEVAEHLPPEAAETFIDSLVGLGPVIVFSAAVPKQGGCSHVNEQWPEYWIELFRKRGCIAIDCFRSRLWHRSNVSWWYAQNLFLFVAQEAAGKFAELQQHSHNTRPFSAVHPRMFLEKLDGADLRNQSLRNLLSAIPPVLSRTMKSRWKRLSQFSSNL